MLIKKQNLTRQLFKKFNSKFSPHKHGFACLNKYDGQNMKPNTLAQTQASNKSSPI